jgi:DNA-binding transcriptional regulator YhcF (GntR family)
MEPLSLDPSSTQPPFEQLRTQIAARVATGALPAGTKLPTVRQLATELGLATNTVARAYRELEADEVIVTEGRRGSFVRSSALDGPAQGGDEVRSAAATYASAARRAGLTLEEAVRLLQGCWGRPV